MEGMTTFNKKLTACAADLTKKVSGSFCKAIEKILRKSRFNFGKIIPKPFCGSCRIPPRKAAPVFNPS